MIAFLHKLISAYYRIRCRLTGGHAEVARDLPDGRTGRYCVICHRHRLHPWANYDLPKPHLTYPGGAMAAEATGIERHWSENESETLSDDDLERMFNQ